MKPKHTYKVGDRVEGPRWLWREVKYIFVPGTVTHVSPQGRWLSIHFDGEPDGHTAHLHPNNVRLMNHDPKT